MSGLLTVLSQTATSLDAQQSVTATLGNNISNANTAGYSLQVANLEEIEPSYLQGNSYIGQGVNLQSVTQERNSFVEAQIPASLGSAGASAALSSTLASLSALDTTGGDGLSSAIGSFYSALEDLSQNPGEASYQQATVSAAQSLALAFNQTSQSITSTQDGVDTQVSADVSQVNGLASQIASLNSQISQANATGASPNSLKDERQQLQDQLETLTGATPVPDAAGDANLVLADGQPLVSGDASATLSTLPNSANDGHVSVQYSFPNGTATTTLTNASFGGTIGGLLSARDGGLATASSQLDQLAYDVGTALNTVQTAGFTGAGVAGAALFTLPTTSTGAASTIAVSAAIAADPSQLATASTATGGTGDGSNVLSMLNTESQSLSTGEDVSENLASITAEYGSTTQSAQTQSTADAAASANLQTLRQSTSGVNINDEMTSLDQTQQIYQALTQVISTTNTMLDSLMNITQSQ